MDTVDALEDWVAIVEHPFLDKQVRPNLNFHVAWNDVELKVAITCRESSRMATDETTEDYAGAFSFRELQSIHELLSLVHPSLGPYMPNLPEEARGIWAYISEPEQPPETLCQDVNNYLRIALDVCGKKLLLDTLFGEPSYDEYFENISVLKRRIYDEKVANVNDEMQNVMFLRSGSVNMLDMVEVYSLEDEVLFKTNVAYAELYNYLLQPFLDMRELSFDKLREAKNGLENPNYGQRRKLEFAEMFKEWQTNYNHALDRIQELYMEYYSQTSEIYTGNCI